jgi:hypothetical protein
MVTPADGPSFGMAPAGTWTCRSRFASASGSMPMSLADCWRTWLSAARADSCMTLPSWPVSVSAPLPPGNSTASMNRTSPPVSVHATPVATPGPGRPERRFRAVLRQAEILG